MIYIIAKGAVAVTVCGEHLLVKTDKNPSVGCNIRQVNEEAKTLFLFMQENPDREDVIRRLTEHYGIDEKTAESAYDGFGAQLATEGFAEGRDA
ncbi:MAG: PqqD family protein [Clostridia bacterium]|nr:PqqD family protein [Clostridia bacterium]